MPIHKAKKAAQENLNRFIDSHKEPAMFNVNVALFNIAEGIEKVLSRVDDLEKRIKDLER